MPAFPLFEPIEITVPGPPGPPEMRWMGDQPVIVHHDDLPPHDRTVVHGIPCTTALRTVIDLASRLSRDELRRMVEESLARELFTLTEARARLAEADLRSHHGARLVRELLGLPEPTAHG